VNEYAFLESPNLTHFLATSANTPARESAVLFGARVGHVDREFSDLRKIYANTESFTADAADKAAFLSSMTRASVFHYAGHSEDASDSLRSSVLLDGEHEGPNSVTAVEISQQRMRPNSTVILASCDSSIGNSRDGVGIRGLTSAFLIAGAGSVVGSLWPVEDASTSHLVIDFHDAFATAKVPVAQALRRAQLAFLQDFPAKSHPYYWSGFVVSGNAIALR
jgi:CHAT domain-containing protein